MKDERMRVDCEYLGIEMKSTKGVGDQMMCAQTPSCSCNGAPNHNCLSMGRTFAQRCSECEHNRWPSESCG